MSIKRSTVEFSKRVFLDRLTTDQQDLRDTGDIDAGPGDEYDYGGVGDAMNFGIGFDCSGLDFIVIGIAMFGPDYFKDGYKRLGTTETFPGPFPGFRQVSKDDCVNNYYPIKVMIGHYGGGANSHMACLIDDWHMESNGTVGICGGQNWRNDPNVTRVDSNYWNDWWVLDGPIEEDTPYRTPTHYPLVLDYSAARLSGASLKRAGVAAVCRYLFGDGTNLPNKQLHRDEADDLIANGIGIVSNFEQATDNCKGGFQQGVNDANHAVAVHNSCGGPDDAIIYFSVDYDAPESDQPVINSYFDGIASVIGLQRTAAYGGYWIIKRLYDAGKIVAGWQTEAWSGTNFDARDAIIQRNKLGYITIDGCQCDYNEAHRDNFGQWGASAHIDVPPVTNQLPPPPVPVVALPSQDQMITDLWNLLVKPIVSQSRYREDGQDAIFARAGMIGDTNAFSHEDWVERRAIFGSKPHIDLVVRNAQRGDYLAFVAVERIPPSYLEAAGYSLDAITAAYKVSYDPNRTVFAK